jgi:YidC/Oxa1 family membrane protein insertase
VAIILLTITVMLLLFPLTAKSSRSMLAMQRLQPEIKKLQAKHKGDRQKLNEEMMKLYQENKVNPLGGCLPLVVQFPVFIALFHAAPRPRPPCRWVAAVQGHHCRQTRRADVPRHGPVAQGDRQPRRPADRAAVLHPRRGRVLTGFLQSRQSQRNTPAGANAQMQMITKVLPIAFGAFSLFFRPGWSCTSSCRTSGGSVSRN